MLSELTTSVKLKRGVTVEAITAIGTDIRYQTEAGCSHRSTNEGDIKNEISKTGIVTNGDSNQFMKTKTILESDFGRRKRCPKVCAYFSLGSGKLNTELASVRVYIHA